VPSGLDARSGMHREWQEMPPLTLRRGNAQPRLAGDALSSSACLPRTRGTATRSPDARTGIGERVLDSSGAQGRQLEDRLWTIPLIAAAI
jgi:hypothetical protein